MFLLSTHIYMSKWTKQGPITYSTDRENEDFKIFITPLSSNRGGNFQFKQTFQFDGPHSEIRPANWEI